MHYSTEIDIYKPMGLTIELYTNPDHYDKWMEGLVSYEPLSGEPGEVGSKARFKFNNGGREIEMVETILTNRLPEDRTVTYEAKGVFNTVKTSFVGIDESACKCINEQDFQFKGFMRLMAMLMPGAFKKQSRKIMKDFKEFVEKGEHEE